MRNSFQIRFAYVLFFLAFSCEKISPVEAEAVVPDNRPWEQVQSELEEEGLHSEQRYRPSSMSEDEYQGAINAVKKAYQLTDISFTPLCPIDYNFGVYQANITYTGMVYSSVKELGTYVGSHVSFHTFMTAVNNPRSKLYTEKIDKSPYHGTNCRSYYGTVCSGLVSYALGLIPVYGSFDFPDSDVMEEIDISDFDVYHIADVLWRDGHVAIITDVVRDSEDRVVSVEVSESIIQGCRRYTVSRDRMVAMIDNKYRKLLRYTCLETNTDYSPAPEFVNVMEEELLPFKYNEICVDKGDRSCYFVGEDVVLNILATGDIVEIYKDGVFYSSVDVSADDIRLSDLECGFYQARVCAGSRDSGFTDWIVVDRMVVPSVEEMRLYFGSENSRPLSVFVCSKNGGRLASVSDSICRQLTEDEISNGYLEVPQERLLSNHPFFVVSFQTEYGIISTTPIEWK
jgi:hypothetical protein